MVVFLEVYCGWLVFRGCGTGRNRDRAASPRCPRIVFPESGGANVVAEAGAGREPGPAVSGTTPQHQAAVCLAARRERVVG